MDPAPRLTPTADGFVRVTGRFWRGIPAGTCREEALAGSRRPGRYSHADQRTLYLSASPEGVEAALRAHARPEEGSHLLVAVNVEVSSILDLRDRQVCAIMGITVQDAASPWKDMVRAGVEPPSWRVRRAAEQHGARGLIDPSRAEPNLWHLVIFAPWDRAVRLA